MYYKVIKDGKVIDVLNQLVYLRLQPKHNIIVSCELCDAQAILSSDESTIWHEASLNDFPVPGHDTVTVIRIDEHEYKKLKALNGKTAEEIIDEYTALLLQKDTRLFVESLMRLYGNAKIEKQTVNAMVSNNTITQSDADCILNAH